MRLTLPNLIRLSGGTSINGITYDEYSASTFTATTNGSGSGTLTFVSSATTYSGIYGQKVHYLEIIGSSAGSTIGGPGFGTFLRYRYTEPAFGVSSQVGANVISATTSGDACNNISYDTIYKLNAITPNIGVTVYSGDTGSNVVDGNNKWIAIVQPAAPNNSLLSYNTKYAIQIDGSGVITNKVTCP